MFYACIEAYDSIQQTLPTYAHDGRSCISLKWVVEKKFSAMRANTLSDMASCRFPFYGRNWYFEKKSKASVEEGTQCAVEKKTSLRCI